MTTKYGMFKEHVYLKPGGVPVGLESTTGTAEGAPAEGHPEERDGGLNMKVTVGKSGKVSVQTRLICARPPRASSALRRPELVLLPSVLFTLGG